jgi:FkbM family methyltransferase
LACERRYPGRFNHGAAAVKDRGYRAGEANDLRTPFATLAYISRHPLASRHPFRAIQRYFSWQAASQLKCEIEYDWFGGAKFVASRGMTGITGNIYCGLHEFYDMGFLLHFLRAGDLFVDIGANVGSYTVLAAAVCGADVIAIEPDPEAATVLRRNIKLNAAEHLVEVAGVAAGAASGEIRLTTGRGATNSVAVDASAPFRLAQVRTLDEIVGRRSPAMLKMDVEGYEAEVLFGAQSSLAKPSLLAIVTESRDDAVRDRIEGAGFLAYAYDPYARTFSTPGRAYSQYSANLLFLRNPEEVRPRLASAARLSVIGVTI